MVRFELNMHLNNDNVYMVISLLWNAKQRSSRRLISFAS